MSKARRAEILALTGATAGRDVYQIWEACKGAVSCLDISKAHGIPFEHAAKLAKARRWVNKPAPTTEPTFKVGGLDSTT
jgi:hypothetical protein